MSKTKSNLVKVEFVERSGKWGIVGEQSGNVYYDGTRFDCCWALSRDTLGYEYEEKMWINSFGGWENEEN